MGIAPEHQKMIFERFYRIENQVHTVKGTGLGLHLVKVAIEKHHQGKVFVKSKLNEGSTFGFWLPLDKDSSTKTSTPKKIEEMPQQNTKEYQEYKIEKLDDYSKKAEFDAQFVEQDNKEKIEESKNLIFEELNRKDENPIKQDVETPQENTKEDEWEITFEVRDN